MKKLYIVISFLMSFPVMATKTAPGVWVTNETGSPATLRWYKTRPLPKYAWGEKKEIPGYTFRLKDQERLFVAFPPEQPSWVRIELIITDNPALLTKTIKADNSGVVSDPKKRKTLLVVGKNSLPAPYDSTDVDTQGIQLLFHLPQSKHSLRMVVTGREVLLRHS